MSGSVHSFEGRELSASDLRWKSYGELLAAHANDSKTYLTFYSKGRKQLEISFADFRRATMKRAKSLMSSGTIERGRPVVVLLGNSYDSFVTYSALLTVGAVVMPVDPAETIDYVLRVAKFAAATGAVCSKEWANELSGRDFPCTFDFAMEEEEEEADVDASLSVRFDEPATLFFTSGTTGDAKGVLQTLGAALVNAEGTRRAGLLTEKDVLFSCLPLFHVNAFNFSFFLSLFLGSSIVYLDGFTTALWKILRDEGSTVASLSPPVLRLLLKDNRDVEPSRTLRYVISASSALHHADLEGIRERYGARVCQAYGLSETINFTLFTPPDLDEKSFRRVVESGTLPPAGIGVWGQSVSIFDGEGNEITADSTPGEVVVHGWNVFREYLNNVSATNAAFSGAHFHTGDVAYTKTIEGRRFFFLCGRIKETAKRSGVQIYLSEIDQVARDLGLESACAVAFENSFTDEEIGLFLVRPQGENRSHAELLALFADRLPFGKRPKVIVEGSEIPKTSVGKIRRNELKKEFSAHVAARFQDR